MVSTLHMGLISCWDWFVSASESDFLYIEVSVKKELTAYTGAAGSLGLLLAPISCLLPTEVRRVLRGTRRYSGVLSGTKGCKGVTLGLLRGRQRPGSNKQHSVGRLDPLTARLQHVLIIDNSSPSTRRIYIGYYTAVRRYELYF